MLKTSNQCHRTCNQVHHSGLINNHSNHALTDLSYSSTYENRGLQRVKCERLFRLSYFFLMRERCAPIINRMKTGISPPHQILLQVTSSDDPVPIWTDEVEDYRGDGLWTCYSLVWGHTRAVLWFTQNEQLNQRKSWSSSWVFSLKLSFLRQHYFSLQIFQRILCYLESTVAFSTSHLFQGLEYGPKTMGWAFLSCVLKFSFQITLLL